MIYLKAEDIENLFEYSHDCKTKIITIDRWKSLMKKFKGEK